MKKLPFTLLSLAALAVCFCYAPYPTSDTRAVQNGSRVSGVCEYPEYGKDPTVSIFREQVRVLGSEVISREGLPSSTRALSVVAAQSVTLASGKTVTPAEIAEAVIALAATWKTEDDAARAAALAAANP